MSPVLLTHARSVMYLFTLTGYLRGTTKKRAEGQSLGKQQEAPNIPRDKIMTLLGSDEDGNHDRLDNPS